MRLITLGLTLWISGFLTPGLSWAQTPTASPKATLRIDKMPAEPLDVAVYDAGAVSFDRPLASAQRVSPAGVEIPAGDLLVVLGAGRKAPDLHRVKAQPGAVAHVGYRSTEGWSLLARVRNRKTGQPVASAVVSLGADRQEATGADGLALFPGIAANAVDAGVRHPDFVPQTVPGLTGASGALTFREISLEVGGRVRAWVRVKGQPREGARCVMTAREEGRSRVVWEGRASAQGLCQTERVPAGAYLFSVRFAEGQPPLRRPIQVVDGQDSQEDFSFAEIRIHGTVTRGQAPAPGLTVRAVEEQGGQSSVAARALTNQDGTYEMTLARAGRYRLELMPNAQSQQPALQRDVTVSEAGDNRADFALQHAVIEGSILDAQSRPIEGAWVRLHWNDGPELMQTTDRDGRFTFFLEAEGSGALTAGKEGYGDAPTQEIEIDANEPDPVPTVLILNRRGAE